MEEQSFKPQKRPGNTGWYFALGFFIVLCGMGWRAEQQRTKPSSIPPTIYYEAPEPRIQWAPVQQPEVKHYHFGSSTPMPLLSDVPPPAFPEPEPEPTIVVVPEYYPRYYDRPCGNLGNPCNIRQVP